MLNTLRSFVRAIATALPGAERRAGAGEDRSARSGARRRSVGDRSFHAVPIPLARFDALGRLTRWNREARTLFPVWAAAECRDAPTWDSLFGEGSFANFGATLPAGARSDIEVAVGTGDRRRWLRVRAARVANGIEACVEDVTDRKEADLRMRHLAHHDPLTGLLNRRGFDARSDSAIRAARDGQTLMLGYLDLDRFKPVNDMFGHTAGDHVLKQVADRLRANVKAPHTIARVGGDEFVLLFVGSSTGEARTICEAALDAIRLSPFRFEDKAFTVDGSIGLAAIDPSRDVRDIVVACDRACAEAKRGGGGRVLLIDEGSRTAHRHRDEARFVGFLQGDELGRFLLTEFQPIVSLQHPKGTLAYEVLLRVRDQDGGVVQPDRFMGAAERAGIASRLDRHVVAHTLAWLEDNPAHRDRLSFVSINVTRASLNDDRFLADLRSILGDHRRSAARLCFELSEKAALADPVGAQRFVEIVRRHDARLALDDFGAEFTSLSRMKGLRADFVKIDPALARDIDSNPAHFSIVRAIVDVAHDLGMGCVGECAETDAIVRAMLELDVDFAQGFALCKPLAPDAMLGVGDCGALVADPLISALLAVDRSAASAQFDLSRRDPLRGSRRMRE